MKKPLITENIGLEPIPFHRFWRYSAFLIHCPKRGRFRVWSWKNP